MYQIIATKSEKRTCLEITAFIFGSYSRADGMEPKYPNGQSAAGEAGAPAAAAAAAAR